MNTPRVGFMLFTTSLIASSAAICVVPSESQGVGWECGMGRSVLGGQWGCSRGSLDFQENCRNDREGGQVKIGHKGTKEGSQLGAPYSPHSSSIIR